MSAIIKPTLFQAYQPNVTLFHLEFIKKFGNKLFKEFTKASKELYVCNNKVFAEQCTRPWSNLQKGDGVQLGPDATKRYSCKKVSLLHPPDTPGPSLFCVHTEKPHGI